MKKLFFLAFLLFKVVIAQEDVMNSVNDIEPIIEENETKNSVDDNLENNNKEEKKFGYRDVTTHKYRNYFGVCSGITLNYGISYKRWFLEDNFGLHFHIFPLIYRTYEEYEKEYYTRGNLKVGLTFMKTIRSFDYIRLFYYANGTFSYDVDNDYLYINNQYDFGKVEEMSIGVATGPGFEFYVWRFAFDVLLGVSGGYNLDTEEYHVLPAAEVGVHFRF